MFRSIVYHVVAVNFLIGLIGIPFGLSLVLLRYRKQELVLNTISRRSIYFLAAVIFIGASWGLISVLIKINISITTIEFALLAFIAVIYSLGMIFKTISPDDARNFLDPPLKSQKIILKVLLPTLVNLY